MCETCKCSAKREGDSLSFLAAAREAVVSEALAKMASEVSVLRGCVAALTAEVAALRAEIGGASGRTITVPMPQMPPPDIVPLPYRPSPWLTNPSVTFGNPANIPCPAPVDGGLVSLSIPDFNGGSLFGSPLD